MVDNQEQYLHRLCMAITRIATPDKDTGIDDDQEAIINIFHKETGVRKDSI